MEARLDRRGGCLVRYEIEHDRYGGVEKDKEEEGKLGNLRIGGCAGLNWWVGRCRDERWSGA